MIQMTWRVAFGIGEHCGGGGVTVEIAAAEDEHWKSLSFQFVPVDRKDLAANEFLVVLAFDGSRGAHDSSPT